MDNIVPESINFSDKLVSVNRVAKVVKGGKKLSFSALVVVGDGQGTVGFSTGKAKEVAEAIRKATAAAKKNLIKIPLKGNTIPFEVTAKFGAAKVMLKPAVQGTGVIAGGGVRAVMEVTGISDVLTKSLGSPNPINVVRATINALKLLKDPAEAIAKRKPALAAKGAGQDV